MGLIPAVGRKSFKSRLTIFLLYGLLSVLALTILYPFALMVSTSMTNRMDYDRFELIPLVLKGSEARFVRFLGDRYDEREWDLFRSSYSGISARYWNELTSDPHQFFQQSPFVHADPAVIQRFREFLKTLQPEQYGMHNLRDVRDRYLQEVVEPLFQKLGPAEVAAEFPDNGALSDVNWAPSNTAAFRRVVAFKESQPLDLRSVITGQSLWLSWLRREWSLSSLNERLGTRFGSIEQVPFLLPELRQEFFERGVPKRLNGRLPEMEYARFIGSDREWEPLPIAEHDYWVFSNNSTANLLDALFRNYRVVVLYLFEKGYAGVNTLILVLLSVLTSLTVNPLAAYVLSRYKLSATPSILLFCLATSAFPAEVAMIPSFLLLRDSGLLNTFAALVLPGAANGFSIFLLKGFFDSLPQELYEAAEIDGAGEVRKFRMITMPLSAPILAVTALGAFTAAYTGYMWAFVVCQDERIWTLMVWLFQFQQEQNLLRTPWIGMAGLVVASIPTLLVFIFCQNIIMRGIILPSMK